MAEVGVATPVASVGVGVSTGPLLSPPPPVYLTRAQVEEDFTPKSWGIALFVLFFLLLILVIIALVFAIIAWRRENNGNGNNTWNSTAFTQRFDGGTGQLVTTTASTLLYATEIASHNISYNPATGVFTVNRSGIFVIDTNFVLGTVADPIAPAQIVRAWVEISPITTSGVQTAGVTSSLVLTPTTQALDLSTAVNLSSGDTFIIVVQLSGGAAVGINGAAIVNGVTTPIYISVVRISPNSNHHWKNCDPQNGPVMGPAVIRPLNTTAGPASSAPPTQTFDTVDQSLATAGLVPFNPASKSVSIPPITQQSHTASAGHQDQPHLPAPTPSPPATAASAAVVASASASSNANLPTPL